MKEELKSDNEFEGISADNVTDQKMNDDIRRSIKKDAFFGRQSMNLQAEDTYFFGIDRSVESSRHSVKSKLVSPPIHQRKRFMSTSNNQELLGNLLEQHPSSSLNQPRGGSMASINTLLLNV